MSTPLNEPASFPFSQWLVALIGCEAVLPSARATRARAIADVMLAAVPDTNAERKVLVQRDILCSTEGMPAVERVHGRPVPGGSLRFGPSAASRSERGQPSLDRASIERRLQDHQVENPDDSEKGWPSRMNHQRA